MGGGRATQDPETKAYEIKTPCLCKAVFKTSDKKMLPFIDPIPVTGFSFKTEELINNNTFIKIHSFFMYLLLRNDFTLVFGCNFFL